VSDNPIKLWPGPCEDGRETYFAAVHDVPEGWEYRSSKDSMVSAGKWKPYNGPWLGSTGSWLQCRPPARLPDPEAPYWSAGNELVVSWAQMRDRTDLDQWERLVASATRHWAVDWSGLSLPDDYPIRVRRKQR
jgi:hypothetical protein